MKYLKRLRFILINIWQILLHGKPKTPREKFFEHCKKNNIEVHVYKPKQGRPGKFKKAPSVNTQQARQRERFLKEYPNLR